MFTDSSLLPQNDLIVVNDELSEGKLYATTGKSRVRFPMKLLDFPIGLILPAALWSWDRLRLTEFQ
jgi:hypothetical protein